MRIENLTQLAMSRRHFLSLSAAGLAAACSRGVKAAADDPGVLTARGVGDVETPLFYRNDIGTAPGRMHEPTAGTDGNVWTSPLDGNLWRYETTTGRTEIYDLKKLTGRPWKGLHLWPIAHGEKVYLCTPALPKLWVWNRRLGRVTQHDFPHKKPSVYGGFVEKSWRHVYFYDTRHAGVLKWDPEAEAGRFFPCPYELSGTLYMSFAAPERNEIWGSTYTGNDIVRFDTKSEKWTAHHKCPDDKATPTAGGKIFGGTLFVSDHLHGRIFPLDAESGKWGEPIPVPGYRQWFGYLSGGWHFRGKLYMCHSTWTGGTGSLDGEPYHFIGSWSVFDPRSRTFSRLDLPTREGETRKYLMSDYCAQFDNHVFILAVNNNPPRNVIVLQSKPVQNS